MARTDKLMPGGIPRWIRIYDDGGVDEGGSIDRYTVVFTGRYPKDKGPSGTEYPYLAMNAEPFHPQGFGQHGSSKHSPVDTPDGKWAPAVGRKCHLGRRIEWQDIPVDCQKLTLSDYRALWSI